MSMQLLTVLQFLQQLLAYTAVTLCLPRLYWVKISAVFLWQNTGLLLSGRNTYIIYLVFPAARHISGKITLWAGTILPLGFFYLQIWQTMHGMRALEIEF